MIDEKDIKRALSVETDSKLETMKTLGSQGKVDKFGKFYVLNQIEMSTLVATLLIRFSARERYTPEEFVRYRAGLNDMLKFFRECASVPNPKKE
jgi:hypothetical protein